MRGVCVCVRARACVCRLHLYGTVCATPVIPSPLSLSLTLCSYRQDGTLESFTLTQPTMGDPSSPLAWRRGARPRAAHATEQVVKETD